MSTSRTSTDAGRLVTVRRSTALLLSGLLLGVAPPFVVRAQSAAVERPAQSDPYAVFVAEAAQRFGVPAAWIRAVMRVESRGDVRAVSPKGAIGLMQIMPETWQDLRVRHRLGSDAYDPRDNILAGAAYLREMYDRYGSPGFLAAYNAGPGRYEEYTAGGRALPPETRAYVAALSPLVGDDGMPVPVTVAIADPLQWTRAPLFVAQSSRTPTAASLQAEHRTEDASVVTAARDVAAIVPQSAGLFVTRSGAGDPR